MAYELTQEEADEGRRLLHSDTAAFFKWAEEKLVIDHEVFRQTLGKCLKAGNPGRAEKLLNVVIENQTNEQFWKDVGSTTKMVVWRALVFLGAVGGTVYLLRAIF